MGRPKEHDERTAVALLEAAEAVVQSDGIDALSVRRVAEEVRTSTRAVYSLFGSKEGLLAALGSRAFELIAEGLDRLPITDDPAEDLIAAGATVFRNFAIGHPSMFKIAVQRTIGPVELADVFRPAMLHSLRGLQTRVERLSLDGLLDGRSISEAAWQFHALCEGLAALELRGVFPHRDGERIWRDAVTALVTGFASAPAQSPKHRAKRRQPRTAQYLPKIVPDKRR